MFNRRTGFVAALVITGLFGFIQKGLSDALQPYDWIIELETSKLDNQFSYQQSDLKTIEKIKVSYEKKGEGNKKQYENIWYHLGKPVGLERLREFGIQPGDGVSILVKHKEGGGNADEYKAAANASLRLLVDAYVNKNAVISIRVPNPSFESIKSSLIQQGCQEADESDGSETGGNQNGIPVFLTTEPDSSKKAKLFYE